MRFSFIHKFFPHIRVVGEQFMNLIWIK